MGYLCRFALSVVNTLTDRYDKQSRQYVEQFLIFYNEHISRGSMDKLDGFIIPDGTYGDYVKWYECTNDLCLFSKYYPKKTFLLKIVDEDDISSHIYIRNGKMVKQSTIEKVII